MNWKTVQLGDICEISNGSTPLRTNKEYWEDGTVSWFTIEDIRKFGRVIKQTSQFVTEKALNETSLKVVPINTVLLCCTASVGEYAITKIPLTMNQQFNGLILKTNEVIPEFLYHYCSTIKEKLNSVSGSATINFVAISKLKKLTISYPSLAVQKRIVTKLDMLNDEIDKSIAIAVSNAKNAETLFQGYLTEIFERNGDNWTHDTLGNYYDVRDGTHDSPKFYDEGYPLVTSKNLKNGNISFEKIQFVSEEDYISISQRSGVKKGDVLMAMIGTIGNPVVIETDVKFAIKNVALFKTNDEQSPHFLRYYLSSDYVMNKMRRDAKGATQKFVGLGYLRSFPIRTPSFENQLAIVSELNLFEEQTKKLFDSYKNKIKHLEALKQSILQQAFNGELVKE